MEVHELGHQVARCNLVSLGIPLTHLDGSAVPALPVIAAMHLHHGLMLVVTVIVLVIMIKATLAVVMMMMMMTATLLMVVDGAQGGQKQLLSRAVCGEHLGGFAGCNATHPQRLAGRQGCTSEDNRFCCFAVVPEVA